MALRYAKQKYLTYDNQSPLQVSSFGGTDYLINISDFNMAVSPSKYSSVRKVTFAVNVASTNATDLVCRLRIWADSTSAATRTLISETIGPAGGISSNNDPFNGTIPGAGGLDPENLLFDRLGSTVTIQQQGAGGAGAGTAFIEFERFNATDTDFFAVWDSITDDDTYIGFGWALEIISSGASPQTSTFCFGFSMSTTQAPQPDNNSTTYLRMKHGQETAGSGLQNFDDTQAIQLRGLHRFRYNAADWNGITAMHFLIYGGTRSNALGLTFRLVRIDNDSTQASTTLLSETFIPPSAETFVYRTANFFSLLVDGEDYAYDYRHLGNSTGGTGTGDAVAFLEIVQKNMTLTKTYFETGAPPGWTLNGPGLPNNEQSLNQQGLFDPLWFEDYPDEFLLREEIYGALFHRTGANNPEMEILHNTDLTSDVSPDGGASLRMTPSVEDNGSLNFRWLYLEQTIGANNPIDLAGKRRLIPIKNGLPTEGHVWTGVPADHWGSLGLVYSFSVPETEVPELGPLFSLGAFDPEGCASTSAGLGDPGLLVITNGSTIPQHFNPIAGVVEDNGLPVPFCDEVPSTVTGSTAASPLTGLGLGLYTYRYTFRNCCTLKESDPNPDDIIVDTSGESPAATVTLSFAGVRIPGDSQICEICVYRTVLGGDFPVMAKVGCFDPSLTTTFLDDVSDAALDFLNEGLSLLNGPMPCVPVVAEFRNRLFGMGDIPNLSPLGTVSVVTGSDIITGTDDVEWDRCLEGKFIKVQGDCRFYEIDKVLPPAVGLSPPIGRLKLVDEYEGTNDTGLSYVLCGRPNRLYISEPLEPECWPAANFLDVEPGDGDRLMGAQSNFNRLVICKRNKTYVLTFNEQPATEVVVPTRISSDIGCIGPRTFAQVESGTVWLSDRGVVVYDGRTVQHVPESDQMNNLFIDPDNPRYVRRDANGRVIGAVGVFYPKREQYLLLLPTVQTSRGANLMLVWDVKLRNITLLEFCQEFMSMVVAKDTDGNERVYLGDTNGFVWIYDIGDNDGVGFPNSVGTVTGTITEAGIEESSGASFLDDATASFIEGGLPALAGLSGVVGLSGAVEEGTLGMAGACIFTRAATSGLDDPWQVRTVYAATKTRLYITPNWGANTPSVGDEYMIGAINFNALFKPKNYGTDDMQKRDWRHCVTHLPEAVATQLRVELLPDFLNSDPEELTIMAGDPPETGGGRIFDLSFSKGRQVAPVGRLIHNYQAVRISNFAPEQPIRLLNHSLMVTPRTSK
jgi:hypothetical protein